MPHESKPNAHVPICLLAKESAHPSQYAVLLGVVGMVFARNLQHGRESRRVRVDPVTYPLSDLAIISSTFPQASKHPLHVD